MRFAELPTIGVLCDLALAGVLVALLATAGLAADAGDRATTSSRSQTPRATSPCLTIGNVEFIGERTIVTLPEPLGDDRCHSHVREYRGEVGPANLVREYDRY